jgi:hypothetical protein
MSGLRFEEPISTIAEIDHPKYDLTRPRENSTKSKNKYQEPGTSRKEAEKKPFGNIEYDVNPDNKNNCIEVNIKNQEHQDVQMKQQKIKSTR